LLHGGKAAQVLAPVPSEFVGDANTGARSSTFLLATESLATADEMVLADEREVLEQDHGIITTRAQGLEVDSAAWIVPQGLVEELALEALPGPGAIEVLEDFDLRAGIPDRRSGEQSKEGCMVHKGLDAHELAKVTRVGRI
jgi:hypothetical protein